MIRYICATSRREKLLLFISICFTAIFISTGVEWVLTRRRTELQAILTVMHPSFMEVPVDPSVGNFYKVWRYYDYGADSFRHLEAESFPAVPIIYIHGNAGCYQDMRSLGRFVGESTSKLRRENAYRYDERVKGAIFDLYKRDKREMPKDGTTIPRNIQMEAENAVILETPMLGAELFAADFREESNAHSGILMAKEALYLNHSAHVLVQRFLDHYKTVLQEPASDIRRKREKPAQEIVLLAEREYIESGCNVWPLDVPDPSICWSLRKEVSTFSTTERIRREVQRLQREGIWLWTESLGGVVGVFAAVLAPELYAGLVMAGPPLRYPPLLFDAGAVLFQKVIHDAVTMQYINTGRFHRNWSAVFEAPNIYGLLQNLNSIPSAELAGRLDRVSLLNLHGGALEDIIPTRSSQIVRTASRAMQSAEHQFMMGIKPRHAARRDICTEELRGCGLTLTHRGLVYAMQLLDSAGYYVVKTALTRDAGELLGIESMLPPGRDRLFPMILETLPHGMDKRNEEKLLFANRLRYDIEEGNYHVDNETQASLSLTQLCVDGKSSINLQDIPVSEDMDPESWSPLHIFVGSTTYPPEDVLLPRMMFISADRHQSVVPESDVQVRVATKLHLPYRRKDGVGKDTAILRTALSFQALRKHQENLPRYVLPRFCFFVKRGVVASHFSLIHYDVVDPLRLLSGPDVHRKTVSLQTSKLTSVEKYQRFALVRNMRVSHMESELTVEVKDRTVYPVTMCGSLRSLRMTFRGTHGVAMDEPESQQQYFFGPYGRNGSIFKYGWRPFHTAPFNLTNVYVVYVLSSDDRPKISVRDMELVQFPEWSKPSYWVWRFHYERFSWIATASTYSAGAKFLSNYALLFLYLIAIFHSPYMLGEGGTSPGRGALYRVFYAKPVVSTVFVGITMEMLSSYIASQALEVCLQEERPQFSDEDLSAMMGVTEKLVLMFLYGLPPRYDACKYSWIRMATILPFDVAADQVVHVVFGYCCVVMLLLIGYGIYFLSWPLSRVLRPFLTWRLGGKVSVWPYILLWLFPIILHNTVLWMHVSLSTTIACLTAFAVIWSIPRGVLTDTNPRYHYICIISIFTIQLSTHLEGIAFVLRNYVMLPREVLDDFERFESLPEHIVAFTVGQMCLAVIYGTTYLTLLHHEGVVAHGDTKRQAKLEKNNRVGDVGDSVENGKGDGKKVGVEGNTVTNGVPCSLLRGDTTYVIGDMGRQYPALRVFAQVGSWSLAIVTGWVCLVALRRPLEGTMALFGMCMVSAYLALVLLRFW